MREKRQPDFRRPTVRSEPERSRPVGCSDEDRRDVELQKLSEFNESLASRDSTWKKFEWDHLLAEKHAKPTYSTTAQNYGLGRYDLGLQRNDGVFNSEFQGNEFLSPSSGSGSGSGRVSIVDSIVDKIYGTDSCIRESTQSRIMGNPEDGDGLGGPRRLYVEYKEDHGFERGFGSGSHEHMYETEATHQQILTEKEQCQQDLLQNMLKRKLLFDLKIISENPIPNSNNVSPHHQIVSNDDIHEQWNTEDIQQLPLSKSPVERAGWIFDDMVTQTIADSDDWLPSPALPAFMQQHSREPIKTSVRNIKERLGPARRDIKERLGPAGRDIKKRLGPAHNAPKSYPWVKNLRRNKSLRQNLNDIHEHRIVQGGDSSKVKAKRARTQIDVQVSESSELKAKRLKTELPEDSDEFKQLLHVNFLKFVKALNENSALRRKYMEQGGAGVLRCSICGSNSKDFMDTLSLAQHAFTSRMVGSRAEHLGFHKALCTLMGWNITAALNGPWVRQILPDGEALALKEDLIIWPPVVVVHNSSIANCNPDERMIVSTEELSAILKGMGFDRGMAKVCHGRPANQSTMVVSFQGTFSGLEEAERLHKFYAENKYGRAEFKQINFSSSNSSIRGTQIVPVEKVENILYGYLGIADDLDNLDFGTKKHSVVKSKKDIQAIADTPFNSK